MEFSEQSIEMGFDDLKEKQLEAIYLEKMLLVCPCMNSAYDRYDKKKGNLYKYIDLRYLHSRNQGVICISLTSNMMDQQKNSPKDRHY